MPGYRKRVMAGCVALAALAVPSAAHAQYTAPPPAPGFHYIFDGTATGSDASFDKWKFASGTLAQSATQGQATLDAAEGTIRVGASPFGSYWYTPRPFGDAVFRIQYQIENTPTATPNGGIMVRAPYFAYTGADTNAVLAQKPTGFNYDVCGGALAFCNRTTPGASTIVQLGRDAPGPFPPPFEYTGGYCARQTAAGVYNVNGTNGQPLTVNGNANNHQHWTQVYCGHEIQINESLTGGGPRPSTRPDQDRLGLRLPQPQRAAVGDLRAPAGKGVWHQYEIRTIGQQYTIMIDGEDHQPVRQLDPEDQHARGRRADDGAPVHAGLSRPADPRRHRPHLLPRDPGQGHRAGRHPGQHRRAVGHRLGLARQAR